ncbi:MAG: hypothetical protein AB1632_03250 [Nitrospirota bacterium]
MFPFNNRAIPPFIERIKSLYSSMDIAYSEAAAYYGFGCAGCGDNCCEERFYHYTLAEHIYLMAGFSSLEEDMKKEVIAGTEEVMQIYGLHDSKGIVKRVMCPLNFDGLCILYEYRPMICRLHGIPHVIKKTGQPEQKGPGCHKFDEEIIPKNLPHYEFDRTGFYTEMAAIEIDIRRALNFRSRYRKTVAGMIIDIAESRIG